MIVIMVFALLFLIGAALVVPFAWLLRRRFPNLSWAAGLAFSHAIIVFVCLALYPTGLFIPDIPFDDLYWPFLFVPGFHIYYPASQLARVLSAPLFASTFSHFSAVLVIVFIPGLICLLVGSLQWYLIGLFLQFFHKRQTLSL